MWRLRFGLSLLGLSLLGLRLELLRALTRLPFRLLATPGLLRLALLRLLRLSLLGLFLLRRLLLRLLRLLRRLPSRLWLELLRALTRLPFRLLAPSGLRRRLLRLALLRLFLLGLSLLRLRTLSAAESGLFVGRRRPRLPALRLIHGRPLRLSRLCRLTRTRIDWLRLRSRLFGRGPPSRKRCGLPCPWELRLRLRCRLDPSRKLRLDRLRGCRTRRQGRRRQLTYRYRSDREAGDASGEHEQSSTKHNPPGTLPNSIREGTRRDHVVTPRPPHGLFVVILSHSRAQYTRAAQRLPAPLGPRPSSSS